MFKIAKIYVYLYIYLARMKNTYLHSKIILLFFLAILAPVIVAQQVTMTSPQNMAQFTLPATIPLSAEASGVVYPEPTFLLVQNTLGGSRKLKLGYSPTSLYSPMQNVVAGGNTHIEIKMKLLSAAVDWTKILIKPMGLGSLSLQSYIAAIGGLGADYKVISIPLSDFISTINFTQVANIEFPYSSNAASFQMAIASIRFTGGTTPFTWFGEGKTDNKHNGFNGSGELLANLVGGLLPMAYPLQVDFYANDAKIGEALTPPYSYNWIPSIAGNFSLMARMIMSDDQFFDSPVISTEVVQNAGPTFSVSLTTPQSGDTLTPPANIELAASVLGLNPPQTDYILVTNTLTGYRKLKLGYGPLSLYSPVIDVTATGNTAMEITLRDVTGGTNWSKIQLRPAGSGSLSLLPYVNAVGGIGNDWKTITIPLSDFLSTINFSALANIEFPYSASAGNFQLAVKSIRFIGGTTPLVWFGYGKTDNKHNGNGGSGELVANVILENPSIDHIEKVEFYSGASKLGEDFNSPYAMSITDLPQGSYPLSAKVVSHQGLTSTSPIENLVVYQNQPTVLSSTMTVDITSPVSGASWLAPLNMPVSLSFAGAILPGLDYLLVTNTLTGTIKMKLGYSQTSLYTPKQNVVSGGNDTLEMVIKNMGGPIDWSKIRVRPAGVGLVNLGAYANAVGGIGNEWKTIKIPLSVFDSIIDFTTIGFIEFPFSAGANSFQIAVQRIRFTGGSSPFTWFGNGKTNNAHDGDGLPGHMSATVVTPNSTSVDASAVQLFDNGVMVSEDLQAPFNLMLNNLQAGVHNLYVKMTDTRDGVAFSDTVMMNAITEVPPGHFLITVQFDHAPTSVSVQKAPLRYDKDFAYSLSFDDGLVDANTCAFKLLGGGYSPLTFGTYPGLFYTDGCGNPVPFKAGLMWNSVNSSYLDIHINTPSYINWTQLNEMLDAGWSIVNHAYSHATGPGTNYTYEINANDSAVFSRTGHHMNHIAAPSGDVNYFPVAFQLGSVCGYSRTTTNGYPFGLKIDDALNYNQFLIYRDFKSDDVVTPATISNFLDSCANLSQNGNHYWYNDFTHHVSPNPVGGSLIFPTFQTYMEHAESTYGQSGSDRMWMASGVEVFEYLKLRDSSPLTWSWNGNLLRILINRDSMPDNMLNYAMSVVIDADANITSIQLNDDATMTYRGTTPRKLINLEWQAPPTQTMHGVTGDNKVNLKSSPDDHEKLGIQQYEKSNAVLISLPTNVSSGKISVFDELGQAAMTMNSEGHAFDRHLRVEFDGLKQGFYVVRFAGIDGTAKTGKFYYYPQ